MTVVDEINTKNALRITNAWLSEVQYEAPYFGCGDMEAIKKALEKQIPKKPIEDNTSYSGYKCPACNSNIYQLRSHNIMQTPHCIFCGQALDWGK